MPLQRAEEAGRTSSSGIQVDRLSWTDRTASINLRPGKEKLCPGFPTDPTFSPDIEVFFLKDF